LTKLHHGPAVTAAMNLCIQCPTLLLRGVWRTRVCSSLRDHEGSPNNVRLCNCSDWLGKEILLLVCI